VTVTLAITGEPVNQRGTVPDPEFLRDSIRDRAFRYDVMDGDRTDVQVTVHNIDVEDVDLCPD
jgi:hypothetical protein